MKFSSRARAQRLARAPFEIVPLAVATLILLAVPIARATAASPEPAPSTGAATVPLAPPFAQDAAFQPKLSARVSDRSSTARDGIHVRGLVTHAGSGPAKVVFRARRAGSKAWFKIVATKVKPGKKFTLTWNGQRPGRYLTKLTVTKYGKSTTQRLGAAFVFRKSFASYYGPGFYGGGMACGGRLSTSTVGVAHKTLPCGTKVTFKVGNRIVTTRVVDRGPYVSGRDWDLTSALKRKLGFGSTGTVHATS